MQMKNELGDRPGFSVVIPTYRRRRSLERVLAGIRDQAYPRDRLEVIVVNDGGDDGTVEMVRTLDIGFKLSLLEQHNLGPGAARNLGLEHATLPFVLFLDDDVVPTARLVAEHASVHGDRRDLVVIGSMLGDGRERTPWMRWESVTLAKQYDAMDAGLFRPTPWQFYTGNASLLREHVARAGGFDPRYRRAEDIELGFRLEGLGLTFAFHRGAEGRHLSRRSYTAWLDVARQYGRNDVLFGKVTERVISQTRRRHRYTRRLIDWGIGHRRLRSAVAPAAKLAAVASSAAGLSAVSMAACSAVFNFQYWLGVEEALGTVETQRLLSLVEADMEPEPGPAGRESWQGGSRPIGLNDGPQ
jgi:glycosyltransferase involved in cell wall biosynthesis